MLKDKKESYQNILLGTWVIHLYIDYLKCLWYCGVSMNINHWFLTQIVVKLNGFCEYLVRKNVYLNQGNFGEFHSQNSVENLEGFQRLIVLSFKKILSF